MNADLPSGKIKVTGVIENQSWRERHEAQKRARAERIKDPALRAKYEARQQAKAAREEEHEAQVEARIQERVRAKMLHETYKQLGIEEGYIENKQAQIDAARAKNPSVPAGTLGRLQTQEQVAMGAGGSAAADQREMRGLGKDIVMTAGTATIAAAGGLEAVAVPIIGEAAFAGIMEAVGMIAGASFLGPAVAIGTIAILTRKLMKKAKSRRANQADQSQKLDDYQADLDNFKKQLDTVQSQLLASQDQMVEKYKTMKKGEFNAYLKNYIADLLKSAGLTADAEATNEAAQKIAGQVESAAGPTAEAEGEGPNAGEASEVVSEGVGPETEAPEVEAPEGPEVEEPEGPAVEGVETAPEDESEIDGPVATAITAEEIAAEKDAMMAEGLIENQAEKDAQIQERIRQLAAEKAKAESQAAMEENVARRGE